jgi:release factor glutamine methyltransferase
MSIAESLIWGTRVLTAAGIDTPRVDAELLAAHALGIDRNELKRRLILGDTFDAAMLAAFETLINERAKRIPLQHITGKAAFRYLELAVGPGVFIPRPETESVAGAGIAYLSKLIQHRTELKPIAVDLCTGSGAIALALATECPKANVYAVELTESAHNWAARNIAKIAPQITLIRGDARTALTELNGQVDLVISNPPYIPPTEIPADPEVAEHDPASALYGDGVDGLEIPRGIAAAAARLLKPGGLFVMEHGDNQGAAVIELVRQQPFTAIAINPDLTKRDRFVTAIRKS